MTTSLKIKIMRAVLTSFLARAIPVTCGNQPTLEAENFSYCLSSTDRLPTLAGTKQGSLEYFRALYGDTITGTSKPRELLAVDSSWAEAVDSKGASTSMYGYHLLHAGRHGYSQLNKLVRKLRLDSSSRQAVFLIHVQHQIRN